MSLAARLEPLHDALADLTREYRIRANGDNEPDTWQTWADLATALMAVRAAQGRAARAEGYPASIFDPERTSA